MTTIEKTLQYGRTHRDEHLAQLKTLLSIPSISAQPDHRQDCLSTARWLADHMTSIGLKKAEVLPTDGQPAVYAEWLEEPDAPVVLIYGHYDVQPPDPLEEWQSDPFQPEVRDGNLYARGASDDKGQLFAALKAVEGYLQGGDSLPVNIKVILEGEEEIGSPSIVPFMQKEKERLAADVAMIVDGYMLGPDQPSIPYSLRGMVYMEVEVHSASHDMHSGFYGGAAHNPIQVLAEIIAKLKDTEGRITIPGFYDQVVPLTTEEREEMARIPFDVEAFKANAGLLGTWGEAGYTALERTTARPSLDCNGIIGGYTGAGVKTVLPARALAKISMRIVSNQEPEDIARRFSETIHHLAPPTVSVEVRQLSVSHPALVDRNNRTMQAAAAAYERGFGSRAIFTREGGTLPIVAEMQRTLGVEPVMMVFGLPDDNLHAPNEKLQVDCFYRGIETIIHFFDLLAQGSG